MGSQTICGKQIFWSLEIFAQLKDLVAENKKFEIRVVLPDTQLPLLFNKRIEVAINIPKGMYQSIFLK